jgi:hypothetical protein
MRTPVVICAACEIRQCEVGVSFYLETKVSIAAALFGYAEFTVLESVSKPTATIKICILCQFGSVSLRKYQNFVHFYNLRNLSYTFPVRKLHCFYFHLIFWVVKMDFMHVPLCF